jgi:predicted dehydrogenase
MEMKRTTPFRVVVIGAAHPGAAPYFAAFVASPDAALVGAVEPGPNAAREVAERHQVEVFSEMSSFATRGPAADLAIVCVPSASYLDTVGRALTQFGWDTLVSALPHFEGRENAERLHAAARQQGGLLMHHSPREQLTPRLADERILRPVGQIVRAEVRWAREGPRLRHGGTSYRAPDEVILELALHALPQLLWSGRPLEVEARTSITPIHEGMREEASLRVSLPASNKLRERPPDLKLERRHGSRATLSLVGTGGEIEAEVPSEDDAGVPADGKAPIFQVWRGGGVEVRQLRALPSLLEAHRRAVAHFVGALRRKGPADSDAIASELALLRLVDAVNQALVTGQPIRVTAR